MRRAFIAAILSVTACAPERTQTARVASAHTLTEAIDRASVEYHVPREVLMAVSYAETRWTATAIEEPEAAATGDDREAHGGTQIGPMHLRHGAGMDSLRRAEELLGVDEADLRASLGLQVAGAAAVLGELGQQHGASETNVDSWAESVALYSGVRGSGLQASYAEQVWEAIRQGRRETTLTGEEMVLAGRNGPSIAELLGVEQTAQFSTDYPPARWIPAASGNGPGARGRNPTFVTIHDTEGSYAGTISWFQNPSSGVATHYVIRSSDGEVTQMLRDSDAAWHVANSYYNANAIAIEHEGFYMDPARWYTEAMYVSSARLTRHVCDRYGIPIDRAHIFGHYQVYRSSSSTICQTSWDSCRMLTGNHVDPGPGWNWDHYMDLVRGGGTVGPMYAADLVTVNYPMDMASGARAVAYVEYRNTGSAGWDVTNTRLGTTGPRDHAGRFYDTVNWINPTRPSAVDAATAAGAIGRFSFMIQAPTVSADTTVTESFGLVQESVAWFGPADTAVTFNVRVHAGATTTDAGMTANDAGSQPDVAVTDSGTADAGTPTRDGGLATDAGARDTGTRADVRDGAADGGGTTAPAGCGCRTAYAPRSSAMALLGIAAALATRRRRRTH